MSETRFDRIKAFFAEPLQEADAIIVTDPNNVFYTSDIWIPTLRVVPERLAIPMFMATGDPAFVVANIAASSAKGQSKWIADFPTYVEFKTSPMETVAEVLKARGLKHRRILIEKGHLSTHYSEQLQRLLPGVKLDDATPILARARMIKSEEEIGLLQTRIQLTEKAIVDAYKAAKVGDTEQHLAGAVMQNVLNAGFDVVDALTLVRGRADALNVKPSQARLTRGDMVRIDVIAVMNGWRSDIHRTAIVGQPNAKQKECWKKNRDVHYATIDKMRVGATPADVYRFCLKEYEKVGLTFDMPHIGHGFGIALHEDPMLSPFHTQPFEPGMVFMLEPMGLHPDVGGFCIEDQILITENGPKVLSTAIDTAEMIVIE